MRQITLIILFIILLKSVPGQAQTGVTMNAANYQDPKLMLVNPAAMAFQDGGLFVSGYKLYYVSLGDERLGNFYSGLSYPLFKLGTLGLTVQWFHAGIFQQIHGDLNYAMPMSFGDKKFSLSGRVGFLGVSYHSEKFRPADINDPPELDDPLLSKGTSKYKLNVGVGILANPFADLYLGFSANHLNRPDLSLAGSQKGMAISANVSAMYGLPLFHPQISLEREANETYLNFGLEGWLLEDRVVLRSNFSKERWSFGAAYHFGKWRSDYEYDYMRSDLNEVSDGNHQITFSYHIGRISPPPPPPPELRDFTIIVAPFDSTACLEKGILPGQTAIYKIAVLSRGGFSQRVTLDIENLPEGVSAQFSSRQITPTDSCTLQITENRRCRSGFYKFLVKGASDKIVHRDSSALRVRMPSLVPKVLARKDTMTITMIRKIAEESPLLNYIFFEEGDDQIPAERYVLLDPARDALPPLEYFTRLSSISEQYRNVLNLFGRRLRDSLRLKITLVGCNAGVGIEKDSLDLSRRRAQHVKDYFVNVWRIAPDRIKVESRHLPANPSSLQDPRSRAENRRVEIQPGPGSEEILAAFATTLVETEFSDPTCVFLTQGTAAEAGVRSWQLVIKGRDGQKLRHLAEGPMLPDSVVWDWRDDTGSPITFQDSLAYSLSITDSCEQTNIAYGPSIHMRYVERVTETELKISRSRLIFFAFDKYQLDLGSPRLQSLLEKIVTKFHQRSGAKIEIRGHTDIIGDPIRNDSLAVRRAQAVKDELIRRGIPGDRIAVEGFGSRNPLMANDLPEGRMMNRRVEVDVIYPQ